MAAPYPTQPTSDEKGAYPPQDPNAYPPSADQQGGYSGAAYPAPTQGGYPPQQGGYPPQQGEYPPKQEGYPPQQGGYPAQPQGAYPPPYQPTQGYTQQQQDNVVVVAQQPSVVTTQVHRPHREVGLGIGGIIFAVFTTICLASFGCWWALPCSIIGIVLGITSTSSGDSGDNSSARTQAGISIACTVGSWVTVVIGLAIIIGVVVSVVNNTVSTINTYNSNFYN